MEREKKLVKNTLILSIGNLFTKLITFFLLPLYTAILSTEEYGIVDLLNTLVSLLLPIVTFQIEQAVFRYLIENRENERQKKKIISTSFFIVIVQIIIYMLIFVFVSNLIKNEYKIFLATNVIVYILASLLQQIARGFGDNKSYTISSIFSGIFTIVFNVLFLVALDLHAYGMLIGTMIGQIACIVYLFLKLKIYKYLSINCFDKKMLYKMWRYSLPLIPNSISWWVFNASDRVIVSMILGLSMTGILSAANKFSTLYIMVYNFFHLSWLEIISLYIKDSDIESFFNNIFNKVLKIFISIALCIIAVMPFVYPIIINQKFAEGYNQIPIIMIGSILNVVVALETAVYVAKKDTKSIAITSGIAAILNILLHLILIKYIGLYAASISTLLAYFIMMIYRHVNISKKYYKIKINISTIISTFVILGMIMLCYYINYPILNLFCLTITILFSLFINKEFIVDILNMIQKRNGKNGKSLIKKL